MQEIERNFYLFIRVYVVERRSLLAGWYQETWDAEYIVEGLALVAKSLVSEIEPINSNRKALLRRLLPTE